MFWILNLWHKFPSARMIEQINQLINNFEIWDEYLVQSTSSCKLPLHLWHWVHNLLYFSSIWCKTLISFWKISDSLLLQCIHTAPFSGMEKKENAFCSYTLDIVYIPIVYPYPYELSTDSSWNIYIVGRNLWRSVIISGLPAVFYFIV